jgi:hypothetical protein
MRRLIVVTAALLTLTACTQKQPKVAIVKPVGQTSVALLQRVNAKAFECWRQDKAFKAYGIIPELDTTGTPRILIIPKGKPQALPKLVIVANGKRVTTFGPLATSPLSGRINSDLNRWAAGDTACNASA